LSSTVRILRVGLFVCMSSLLNVGDLQVESKDGALSGAFAGGETPLGGVPMLM